MSEPVLKSLIDKIKASKRPMTIEDVWKNSLMEPPSIHRCQNKIKIENVECYLKGKRLYVTTTSSMYVG